MDSKMVFMIVYVVYLIIGAVLNNMFVRDVVKDILLDDIASHPELYYSDTDEDSAVSFMQFVFGIIFELFWPIFMVMWIVKTIQILISRKPK
jgi:hypothetical protein